MKWSERFATGVRTIDEQHRMLFRMSEDYRDALDHGQGQRVYGVMLDSLYEYARAHFSFEEDCMCRHHCPAAETNKDAHRQFVETLTGYRLQYDQSGFVVNDARRLMDLLDAWLENHIGRIDTQLKPCVEAQP